MTILEKITAQTREDVNKQKQKIAKSDFTSFPMYEKNRRSLYEALSDSESVSIIAEVKKASPSKGLIREDFQHERIAEQYMNAGAAAISVLTDKPFFKGDAQFLTDIAAFAEVPILRKDFIIDFYQVEEAKAIGADAILLIASILDGTQLQELHHAATEAGLECLVECYTEEEVHAMDYSYTRILGVNNRNLNTFEVDVHRGIRLLQTAPDNVVTVSESGLSSKADINLLLKENIHSALIGEHFMRQPDPGKALKALFEEN